MRWLTALCLVPALLCAGGQGLCRDSPGPELCTVVEEMFPGPHLDPERWRLTSSGDFRDKRVDLQIDDRDGRVGARLRMRADTRGTRDNTVKYLGVLLDRPLDLSSKVLIEFELDWNRQVNGSYLTAGLYLAPAPTPAAPELEDDWLKIEYIGVPPGRNGRSLVALKQDGRLRRLDSDGWPGERREGRLLGTLRVRVMLDGGLVQVYENGELLFAAADTIMSLKRAWLFLQMSSHSNYPAREVFFDDIVVRSACAEPPR